MSTTSNSYAYGPASGSFTLSSLVERVQDWLKDVQLNADQDMDLEEWAYFENSRLEEEDMIVETLYEALFEDAYFDTLEKEEKETVNEAFYEDAYFDTLERQEIWVFIHVQCLVWRMDQIGNSEFIISKTAKFCHGSMYRTCWLVWARSLSLCLWMVFQQQQASSLWSVCPPKSPPFAFNTQPLLKDDEGDIEHIQEEVEEFRDIHRDLQGLLDELDKTRLSATHKSRNSPNKDPAEARENLQLSLQQPLTVLSTKFNSYSAKASDPTRRPPSINRQRSM